MSIDFELTPIILCGGSGSRLWPLSRGSFPKQYLSIDQKNNGSFLQMTIKRLSEIENLSNPIFVCNEEHRFITAEQIRSSEINFGSIILEPERRNTAPAILAAALKSIESGKDPILFILPSDHVIKDKEIFLNTVELAQIHAHKGRLVTFGVIPTRPETGYGYIKAKHQLNCKKILGSEIETFIEKPDLSLAETLIKDKRYTWNSGMFMFRASIIIDEIKKFEPEIYKHCKESIKKKKKDLFFERLDKESFKKCPAISIDTAVMEKTHSGYVLPLNSEWIDIGSWRSYWDFLEKDNNGNVLKGDSLAFSSFNNLIISQNRLVVGLGINDLTIIETSDAILVAQNKKTEEVKNIVNYLIKKGRNEGFEHKKIFRPWGNYTNIQEGKNWKIKKIEVKAGASLSLQLHLHRTEHWIVVYGRASIEIDNKKFILEKNQSCFVPCESKHRLSNFSDEVLIIIEIQSGSYLGEDDIKRFEDNYGRNNL